MKLDLGEGTTKLDPSTGRWAHMRGILSNRSAASRSHRRCRPQPRGRSRDSVKQVNRIQKPVTLLLCGGGQRHGGKVGEGAERAHRTQRWGKETRNASKEWDFFFELKGVGLSVSGSGLTKRRERGRPARMVWGGAGGDAHVMGGGGLTESVHSCVGGGGLGAG